MEKKLTEKQKNSIKFIGITGIVYLSFKYLLPIVIPFLIAYFAARLMNPAVNWLHRHLKLKPVWGAVVTIIIVTSVFAVAVFFLSQKFMEQLNIFMEKMPLYIAKINEKMSKVCTKCEKFMRFKEGYLMEYLRDMEQATESQLKNSAMPFVMSNSITMIKFMIEFSAVFIIVGISTVLCVKESESIQNWMHNSIYKNEIDVIHKKLIKVGGAYLKTQLIICSLTIVVCIVGLRIAGNSYCFLLGIIIGVVDALPVFGTGTVFIPWIISCLIFGKIRYAIILLVTYLICYFLREILEAKLLGEKLGISPLQTMLAMYAGLKLFGIGGLFLGPIGWILIKAFLNS